MDIPELKHDRYLVTGAAGFIGGHLCEEILRQGKRVIALDDFSTGDRMNWVDFDCDIVHVDITHGNINERWFEKSDVIFHNAASKNSICMKDPHRDMVVNAWGTYRMAMFAKRYDTKFIHASTGSVYGPLQSHAQDDTHALEPVSYYGVSKLAAEKYLHAMRALGEAPEYSIIRYTHVFGPRQNSTDEGGVVAIFIRNCLRDEPLTIYGDGSQIRCFTYVKDVVAANFLVANEGENGETYNCASGTRISILDLAHIVKGLMGCHDLPIRYKEWKRGDIKHFNPDTSKIEKLGMRFSWNFIENLETTIEWYRGQSEA